MKARVLCAFLLLGMAVATWEESLGGEYTRRDFPRDFVFGAGTSAYQVEGAAAEDGRTPSIWDTAAHAGKIPGATGDIACDGYHKYKDDVKLMKETRLEAYRFSISWSRLLPRIQPHVTLFHYDLPQVLEDEYEGWLSPKIVDDFVAYADVCFEEFGDRVSYWTTLNEPNCFSMGGYDQGVFPPYRCSSPFGLNCSIGDSILEPYIVAHHCLLAHAAVSSLYRTKYQAKQGGFIGLNVFVYFFLPLTKAVRDIRATQRAYDFYVGWFIEPLVNGDYPKIMKERAGSKIPSFSMFQRKQIIRSFDFLGVNYYATLWVSDDGAYNGTSYQRDFFADLSIKLTVRSNANSTKFPITPYGIQGTFEYFKHVYGNPPIFIHENGYPMPHNSSLDDTLRVRYLKAHIGSLLNAIRNGSNAKGYFTWYFLDVFELFDGFQTSYGLYYIDFKNKDLPRLPKLSARWYSHFLKGEQDNAINIGNFSNPCIYSI